MNLRHRIEIWEKSQTFDVYGAPVTNAFKVWKRCFSDIQDQGGSEGIRNEAGERIATMVTDFTIRDTSCMRCGGSRAKQVTPDMRIRYNGENYNIVAVLKYNKDPRFIIITAERDGFREAPNE